MSYKNFSQFLEEKIGQKIAKILNIPLRNKTKELTTISYFNMEEEK